MEKGLSVNPCLGTEIMPGVYKIRLAIKSKAKGKSGGARVISFHQESMALLGVLETQAGNEVEHIIHLIFIYDKSETGSISNTEIRNLIKNME